jgi:hypothetical protein
LLHYCSRFGRQSQTSQRSTSNQESNVNLHYHLHLETGDDQKNQVTTTGGGYVGVDGDTQVQVITVDEVTKQCKRSEMSWTGSYKWYIRLTCYI